MSNNQHYRTRVVRDGYWRERAERAIDEWHRHRGTIDPAHHTAPPLTLRERFAAHRLDRVRRTLEVT